VTTISWEPGEITIAVESAGNDEAEIARTRIVLGDGNLTLAMTIDTEDAVRLREMLPTGS
jgi:hypothetical protein